MNDTVRFERKFIFFNKNISYLENLLRTSKFNFKEDYPSRKVNSIYFDLLIAYEKLEPKVHLVLYFLNHLL